MMNKTVISNVDEASVKHFSAVERAYKEWNVKHLALREPNSERYRRLIERNDHSEQLFAKQIWWPVLCSFAYLHPEYEVNDYRDGSRFLDFAYVRPPYKLSVEIDGFGPHHKNASRRKFSDDRFRQNHLILDDWIVVRFSYDDIVERPRQCQQFLQQLLGKLYGLGHTDTLQMQLTSSTRELIRWAQRRENGAAFSPKEIEKLLRVSHSTAQKYLKHLLLQELVEPASGAKRIRTYRLTSKAVRLHF